MKQTPFGFVGSSPTSPAKQHSVMTAGNGQCPFKAPPLRLGFDSPTEYQTSCPGSACGLHATLVWLRMGFDSPLGHHNKSPSSLCKERQNEGVWDTWRSMARTTWPVGIWVIIRRCLRWETGSSPVQAANSLPLSYSWCVHGTENPGDPVRFREAAPKQCLHNSVGRVSS